MSLTGTEYGELRHNNRESGLDSQLDFRKDRESSVCTFEWYLTGV